MGIALLCVLVGCYVRDGTANIRATQEVTAAQGQVIVVAMGDVALRDVPKAYAMANGHWYDDPHYLGEVHWYPFMQPLLAVGYSALSGEPLQSAYLFAAMLVSAAALPALAVLCATYAGPVGLLCVPLAVLLGIYWPNNTTFPGGVGELFFLLYLAVAAWAFEQITKKSAWRAALFVVGVANGVLALCHGASFVSACCISAALVLLVVVRGRARPWYAVQTIGWFMLGGFLLSAPLIVPQLLHYGTLRQADEARLYLHPDFYGVGDSLASLLTLVLLPRNYTTLAAGAFIVFGAFGVLPYSRAMTAPLSIGFVFALVISHLGFVLNASGLLFVAQIAAVVLVAPPHTFIAIWTLLANLMFLLLLAAFAHVVLRTLSECISRVVQRPPQQLFAGLLALLLIGCYAFTLSHLPAQIPAETEAIPQQQEAFFSRVAALAGPEQTVYVPAWGEQREFLRDHPFNVLFLHTPYHRNPYVNEQRALAERALNLPHEYQAEIDTVLKTYRVATC